MQRTNGSFFNIYTLLLFPGEKRKKKRGGKEKEKKRRIEEFERRCSASDSPLQLLFL